MPSATHPEYSMVSPQPRKRRREDDGGEVQIPFSTFETSQNLLSAINNNERFIVSPQSWGSAASSLFSAPRKLNHPLPVSKRFRLVGDSNNHGQQPSSHCAHHDETPPATPSQSHFSHAHPGLVDTSSSSSSLNQSRPTATTTRANSAALLSPCHICHRKPTKKSDLDSFADCMSCGDRTCFVCLRACPGWLPASGDGDDVEDPSTSFVTMRDVDDDNDNDNSKTTETQRQKNKKGEGGEDGDRGWNGRGHHEVVCSRCCVERGSEGDVVCLGCLSGMREA